VPGTGQVPNGHLGTLIAVKRRDRHVILAAKVAGAVALVVAILIVKPFVRSGPSSSANLEAYASGFDSPTFVGFAPGEPSRLYVVEQAGRIRYLVGRRIAGTLLDIRSRVASGGERGLFSVAFSPDYPRDHRFYVDYTDRNGDTRVVEFRARDGHAVLSSARQLLFVRQPYANHNGGQLQFGPDGLLYVGMGDGGSGGDPENHAQDLDDHLGKLLRIDPSREDGRWETVGYGLRNPWRFSFDRATGDLYIADVGQSDWEEIDFRPNAQVSALANYGWRIYEGRTRFTTGAPSRAGELVFPVSVYSHDEGCSVTGGYVYRGHAASLVCRYFFGDWCSGTIWSLRIEDGRAVAFRKEAARIGQLSSFGEDSAGELYAVSGGSGRLYRVVG
jgi:glucose/arabinose dehydrogenase